MLAPAHTWRPQILRPGPQGQGFRDIGRSLRCGTPPPREFLDRATFFCSLRFLTCRLEYIIIRRACQVPIPSWIDAVPCRTRQPVPCSSLGGRGLYHHFPRLSNRRLGSAGQGQGTCAATSTLDLPALFEYNRYDHMPLPVAGRRGRRFG